MPKRKLLVQNSKKFGCEASLTIKEVPKFSHYKARTSSSFFQYYHSDITTPLITSRKVKADGSLNCLRNCTYSTYTIQIIEVGGYTFSFFQPWYSVISRFKGRSLAKVLANNMHFEIAKANRTQSKAVCLLRIKIMQRMKISQNSQINVILVKKISVTTSVWPSPNENLQRRIRTISNSLLTNGKLL